VDLDNLPSECRIRGGVQKRTRNRRIEEDRVVGERKRYKGTKTRRRKAK